MFCNWIQFLLLICSYGLGGGVEFIRHSSIEGPGSAWDDACRKVCADHPKCRAYTAHFGSSFVDCYIYDELVRTFLEGIAPITDIGQMETRSGKVEEIDLRTWLSNPLVTNANTFSSTEQHFVRGCSYTIALWVWLYKPRTFPDHELDVFTTREVESPKKLNMFIDEALLPSIVFNVGGLTERVNKFFFATALDEFGHYQGFWANYEVRFHEWVHLTMTISEDSFTAYVNGESFGTVYMSPPRRGRQDMYCPYLTSPHAPHTTVPHSISDKVANSTKPAPAVDRLRPYSFAPYSPGEAINNTILQVAGKNNGAIPSTSGMFFDLIVVRNAAIAPDQVAFIKDRRPPPSDPTLYRLLRAFGKYSLEGFCALDISGYSFGWRQLSWGMCPETVCGLVSIDEKFRLGPHRGRDSSLKVERRSSLSASPLSPNRVGNANEELAPAADVSDESDSSILPGLTAHKPRGLRDLSSNEVDIDDPSLNDPYLDAYAGTDGYLEDTYLDFQEYYYGGDYDSELDSTESDVNMVMKDGTTQRRVDRSDKIALNTTLPNRYHASKWNDLFPSPLHLGRSSSDPDSETAKSRSRLRRLVPQVLLIREETADALPLYTAKGWTSFLTNLTTIFSLGSNHDDKSSERNSVDSKSNSSFDRVLDWGRRISRVFPAFLGELSMTLREIASEMVGGLTANVSTFRVNLSSPHSLDTATELYHLAMLLLHDRHSNFSTSSVEPLISWKRRTSENARAYLALALWFTGDDQASTVVWSFRSAAPMTQPLHLALGYSAGFDMTDDVRLPADLGVYIKPYLGGANVYSLLGLQHPSNVDGLELLRRSLGPEDREAVINDKPTNIADVSEVEINSNGDSSSSAIRISSTHDNWLQLLSQVGFFDDFGNLREEIYPLVAKLVGKNDFISNHTGESSSDSASRIFTPDPRLRAAAALEEMRQNALINRVDGGKNIDSKTTELRDPLWNRIQSALERALPYLSSMSVEGMGAPAPRAPRVELENECFRAVSHYFPVSQYVTANFGLTADTGVALLEDVRISSGTYLGQSGEDDELQLHNEAEAEAGNTDAQMWLGRRYFWGYGGLQPNVRQARQWFERAAALGDAEGMYNVGVFHNNGQAGLPVDPDLALDYFIRAANAPNPFPMALHAVGQYFMRPETGKQNLSLAREYFMRAAELNSADGHFSLAMMYRDGTAGIVDIPMCVVHLALAIQLGHIRASNFLAHGLMDPESWFFHYGREVEAEQWLARAKLLESRDEALVRASARGDVGRVKALLLEGAKVNHIGEAGAGNTALVVAVQGGFVDVVRELLKVGADPRHVNGQGMSAIDEAQMRGHQGIATLLADAESKSAASSSSSTTSRDSTLNRAPVSIWSYNASLPITIHLPFGSFALPVPLGRGNTCPVALQLLKNIAENSYRPNDLNKAALSLFLTGDRWGALELYDEASALGVQSAMENAAWLYGQLSSEVCGTAGSRIGQSTLSLIRKAAELLKKLLPVSIQLYVSSVFETFTSYWRKTSGRNTKAAANGLTLETVFKHTNGTFDCRYYFDKMATRRSIQLANTGDHLARRDVADMYARAPLNDTSGFPERWALQPNHTLAALLYTLAAEQGDVHSMVHLAWLFSGMSFGLKTSGYPEVPPNTSVAKSLFNAAAEFELRDDGSGHMPYNTMGIASQLGLFTLFVHSAGSWLSLYEDQLLFWGILTLALMFAIQARNARLIQNLRIQLRNRREQQQETL